MRGKRAKATHRETGLKHGQRKHGGTVGAAVDRHGGATGRDPRWPDRAKKESK
jgi:hypothetical protein